MTDEPQRAGSRWTLGQLKNPKILVTVLLVFPASLFASQLVACNVHELAHAVVATSLGWEVDTIQLCAPGSGSVTYAHVGTWAANLQGYAGGAIAAALLYLVYSRLIAKPSRPLRSPWWWAAGLGIVFWIGPQLVIAVMEGPPVPMRITPICSKPTRRFLFRSLRWPAWQGLLSMCGAGVGPSCSPTGSRPSPSRGAGRSRNARTSRGFVSRPIGLILEALEWTHDRHGTFAAGSITSRCVEPNRGWMPSRQQSPLPLPPQPQEQLRNCWINTHWRGDVSLKYRRAGSEFGNRFPGCQSGYPITNPGTQSSASGGD